jgi:hypothetical protein
MRTGHITDVDVNEDYESSKVEQTKIEGSQNGVRDERETEHADTGVEEHVKER